MMFIPDSLCYLSSMLVTFVHMVGLWTEYVFEHEAKVSVKVLVNKEMHANRRPLGLSRMSVLSVGESWPYVLLSFESMAGYKLD